MTILKSYKVSDEQKRYVPYRFIILLKNKEKSRKSMQMKTRAGGTRNKTAKKQEKGTEIKEIGKNK